MCGLDGGLMENEVWRWLEAADEFEVQEAGGEAIGEGVGGIGEVFN